MSDRNSTCSSRRSDSIFSGPTSANGTRAYCASPPAAPAGQMGVAEDTGDRVAEELLGQAGVGVAVLTAGVQLGPARRARTAGDRERDHHPVAHPQLVAV